jgi:sterol desaturase/sphingolipid hydroxylase (fatty acid hydroxylase superfamily)
MGNGWSVWEAESAIRLGVFAGVLLLMAAAERLRPRRRPLASWPQRWLNNLGLVAIDTLVARLVLPLGSIGVALLAQEQRWGLFHAVAVSSWLGVLLSVIALDLVVYLQHVLFHALPILWRLHMVHHADRDLDTTTGVRFHPIEIVISLGLKSVAVVLLGAPPLGVLLFEILLNATALFNHGNLRLPLGLDRLLRLVLVTPDMHRVHHSVAASESNSNFGFNLPWWDYLFGTYRAQPAAGHLRMTIGLTQFPDDRAERLDRLLLLPFVAAAGDYPVNRERTVLEGEQRHASPAEYVPADHGF